VPERTYYVAVTAYDRTGTESPLSNEITVVIPPRAQHRPTLMQEVLRHGQPTQWWVTGVPPGEAVSFLVSVTGEGAGPCDAQLGGVCVDLVAPAFFGEATADAVGIATVTHALPAETLPGQTLAFQVVSRRGPQGGSRSKPMRSPPGSWTEACAAPPESDLCDPR
jgi:hypothetical protein